jgi:hypothetical protein
MSKEPKITVIERPLGREKATGQAFKDDGLIEIDPRQKARPYFETAIHETLHVLFPKLSERQIILKSKKLTKVLWDMGYRKVNLK